MNDLWMRNAKHEPDGDSKPPPGKPNPGAMVVCGIDTKLFLAHKVHIGVDGCNASTVTAVPVTTGTVR